MKLNGMWSMGTGQIAGALVLLGVTVFVLPTALFEVLSGSAGPTSGVFFVLGLVLVTASLGLAAVGLHRRSRDLRTARTYETREPSSSDADRPVNPYEVPRVYGSSPPPG